MRMMYFATSCPAGRLVLVGLLGLGMHAMATGGAPAQAAPKTVGPGETLTLTEDLLLTGADTLDASGTDGKRCRINGQGKKIKGTALTGQISIKNCDLFNMGIADGAGLDLELAQNGHLVIDGAVFDNSGTVSVKYGGAVTIEFRRTVVQPTALIFVGAERENVKPAIHFDGASTAMSFFQGNRVYRGYVEWTRAINWMIGGYKAEESNVLIGLRCGMLLGAADKTKVVGNYVHTSWDPGNSSQVGNVEVEGPSNSSLLMEHNIFRRGEWVLRGLIGELRYNLILDVDDHDYIRGPRAGSLIHHNVFVRYVSNPKSLNQNDSIGMVYADRNINIYNNTFDGGGKVVDWHVPVVSVEQGFLDSFRSNIIYNHNFQYPAIAAQTYPPNGKRTDPSPGKLGYADYNLFDATPGATMINNYELAVDGKQERVDPGFAKNDIPVGGKVDEQADPRFVGPVPAQFPYDDEDIKSSKVTVAKILKDYRAIYMPAPGSPVIDHGDPQEGAGNDIGAVGSGTVNAIDKFGTLEETPGTPPVKPLPGPDAGADGGSGKGGSGGTGSSKRDGAAGDGVGGASGHGGGAGSGGRPADGGVATMAKASHGCQLGGGRPASGAYLTGTGWLLLLVVRRRRSTARTKEAAGSSRRPPDLHGVSAA